MPLGADLRAQHATGEYWAGRDVWDRTQWCVYSPTGAAIGRYASRKEALEEVGKHKERQS